MTASVDHENQPLCLASWDVSRAHFYGLAVRDLYVELPSELRTDRRDPVGQMVPMMHGMEDAAKLWGDKWLRQLEKHKYIMGASNRAIFRGPNTEKGLCYGDDLVLCASEQHLR